jgi:pantetheine-phosphate adenylyltransferase
MKIVACPGTFDVVHQGHKDIFRSASEQNDKVIIAVGNNSDKETLFTAEQRLEHIRAITQDLKNVLVTSYE